MLLKTRVGLFRIHQFGSALLVFDSFVRRFSNLSLCTCYRVAR